MRQTRPATDYLIHYLSLSRNSRLCICPFAGAKRLEITGSILFGTHTGASIAAVLSQLKDNPATLLVLDSVGLYDRQEKGPCFNLTPRSAPFQPANIYYGHGILSEINGYFGPGTSMTNTIVRTRRRNIYLHGMCVDVLESLETYHLSYNAAFRFDKEACFSE